MHVLIIGGSGRTGQMVIEEALDRGHTVTALVRTPSSLQTRPNLHLVSGTPLSPNSINEAITSQSTTPTAVIITLNARRATDNPWSANVSPPRLMADSVANTVSAMRKHSVKRLVFMSAFGVGDSWPNMHWMLRTTIKRSNMSYQWADHDLVDEEIKASGGEIDWTLVRPVMLKEYEAKEVIVRGEKGEKGVGLTSSIARKSVAKFLVSATEGREWVGKTPVITN